MQKIIILIHRESKRQESKTDEKIYKKNNNNAFVPIYTPQTNEEEIIQVDL